MILKNSNKQGKLNNRFYAPIYVLELLILGIVIIVISELAGISNREINLTYRSSPVVELITRSSKKIEEDGGSSISSIIIYNTETTNHNNNNYQSNESEISNQSIRKSKNTHLEPNDANLIQFEKIANEILREQDEKLKRHNEILLKSISYHEH